MSVGLGVGTVRYSAGAGIGTAVLSPAVRHTSGALTLDFAGSLASLPGGAWAGQGLTGLSLVTPPLLRRSEEHTSELQSRFDLVCRLLLEKKTRSILPYTYGEPGQHSV